MLPPWWTGSDKVAQSRPQRPLAVPRKGGLDMRRRLPGPWVGLAAMFAVIANRSVRGLSGPIRMADLVIQGLACPCGKEKRKNRIRTPICGTYSPSSSALHLRVSILSAQQDLSAPSDRIIGPKIAVPTEKIAVPMEKITVLTRKDNANHGILWDGWELWGNYGGIMGVLMGRGGGSCVD